MSNLKEEGSPNAISGSVARAARASREAVRRLLETRGFLTSFLHASHDDIRVYACMEDVDLAQLFSALAEKCKRANCIGRSRRLPDCTLSILGFLERVVEKRRNESHSSFRRGRIAGQWCERTSPERRTAGSFHGGWGMCLAFMVAYDALADLGVFEAHDNVEADTVGGTKRIRTWENDEIIRKALKVIKLTREAPDWSRGSHMEESFTKPDGKFSVGKCFDLEIKKVDALERAYQETNRDALQYLTYTQESNDKSIWSGIEFDGDDDDVSSEDQSKQAANETLKDGRSTSNKRKRGQVASTNSACHQSNRAREPIDANEDITEEVEVNLSPLDQSSVDLRTTLLNSMPGAAQAEIDSLAERVAELIQQGGTQGGAAGVARIGNILTRGIESGDSSGQNSSTVQTQADDITDEACSPLADELIASVSKKYINRGTSAIRTSAYIRCFVLPLLFDLDMSKPVSRTLMSTILWLARERAAETFSSLLIPVLCPAVGVKQIRRGVTSNDALVPSKALCDLACRVVKSTKEKEAIAVLLSGLVLDEACSVPDGSGSEGRMVWTDESMPVITACINMRACLSDETVAELTRQIQLLVFSMCKSMKFSTLFHALVTKYGHQLRKISVVEGLSQSAERLQTFMGKTIISSLKKL